MMFNITQKQLQQLYEIDDYLWLEETIKLLRTKNLENLDIDNLIEELESLGRSELNKVRSLLKQIIIHILLLEYWQEEYDRNCSHWEGEIIAFRYDLNHTLTTSLKNKLILELEEIYQLSRKLVSKKTGLSPDVFPNTLPYSLEQLLDDNWYPEK